MKVFRACIKKDIIEFMRGRKNVICLFSLAGIAATLFFITKYFPMLIKEASLRFPDMISDQTAFDALIANLFPGNVKGSLGRLASDIGVFYTLIITVMCFRQIPGELQDGKWIMPVNIGISPRSLIASKCIVYSIGTALPVFVVYNLYYFAASCFFENDCRLGAVVINAFVLTVAVACITQIVILSSVIIKNSILVVLQIIMGVVALPDILSFFSIGRFLPTYLLTFTFNVESSVGALALPFLLTCVMIGVLYWLSFRKQDSRR